MDSTTSLESTILCFKSISKKINEADDSITLESDYKYNDSDNIKIIEFKNRVLTIDGNNHAIDADGKTAVFKVNGGNLTLKNLVFKNTNDTAIQLQGCTLNTINVTFINANSQDYVGAIYADTSKYYSTNESACGGGSRITMR